MRPCIYPILTFIITISLIPRLIGAEKLHPKSPKNKEWYLEDFRFGGGIGYGLYLSNQMDYAITTNYGDFNELIPSFYGGVYKMINEDFEFGVQYRHGHLLTLKSENTQGLDCDFDEGQIVGNYSLNHNAGLKNGNFVVNLQAGLGATYFRAKYYEINTTTKQMSDLYSTVGYNGTLISVKDQPQKQLAIIGGAGIELGVRLSNNFCLYWSNIINLSTSNKMSGNLHKKSWIPTDGYIMSSLGLFINFGTGRGRLSCPKF